MGVWIRSWGQGVGVWIDGVCTVRYARWGMQGEVHEVGYVR